jgi:hypothetical protein
MEGIGRALLFLGIAVGIVGLLFMFGSKLPLLGKLPGDLVFRRGESTFYFPLATSIVVSVVLTVVLSIAFRLFR